MIVKPFYRTSEFWATLLVNVGVVAAAFANSLAPRYAAIASAVSVAAYAVGRSITKNGVAQGPSTVVTTQPVPTVTGSTTVRV